MASRSKKKITEWPEEECPVELFNQHSLEITDPDRFFANMEKAAKRSKETCMLCGSGVSGTTYMINCPEEVGSGFQHIGSKCAKIPALQPYIVKQAKR